MLGLVKYGAGPGNMEVRDIPEPSPGTKQVKVEVRAAGICGSDLHIFHSDIAIPVKPPVVIGHEFSGVVTEVGEGVTDFKAGDRVVSETAMQFCGKCYCCREGYYNLCPERKTLGYWFNGVFTNYTILNEHLVHKIPDNIDFISAAMTEPLACVVHAVYDLTEIRAGDVVLVTGPGAIGQMALQLSKCFGATVIVSGTGADKKRLELAAHMGADRTVDVQSEDLCRVVDSMTRGRGADVCLECSGTGAGAGSAILNVKKRGYYTQIGLPGKPIEFDIDKICYKEIKFTGSLASRKDSWERAISLMASGKVNLTPLASARFPITGWEKAFEMFENKEGYKLFLMPVTG